MGSDEDNPRSRYGLSCPVGGQFYICKDSPTRFMGCCDVDPCKNGGICTTSALRSSSFSQGNYGDIPAQDCLVGGAKNWYTCSYNSPPFLGCCLENPCVSGQCHPGNVTAAKLSSDPASAAPFLAGGGSSSSSSADDSKKGGLPAGAIAGIVVGVVVVLAVVGFLLWRLQRQKKIFYHPPATQAPSSPPNHVQMDVVSSPHSQHSAMYSPYKGKFFFLSFLTYSTDTFHQNGPHTPSTLVNSSARTTPHPPDSFYDGNSMRAYSAAPPPLSPGHPGDPNRNSHWAPSTPQSRHVSSHSSMGSEYHGGGGTNQQFQPMEAPISELVGSEVTGAEGTVSEIGSSTVGDQHYSQQHQQQRQQQHGAGLGIK